VLESAGEKGLPLVRQSFFELGTGSHERSKRGFETARVVKRAVDNIEIIFFD